MRAVWEGWGWAVPPPGLNPGLSRVASRAPPPCVGRRRHQPDPRRADGGAARGGTARKSAPARGARATSRPLKVRVILSGIVRGLSRA
ncbi:hypothetical protein KJ865_03185 [Myxococcota bacterium]|nr:hypothetical protein [Myxococcota bacterium]